MLLLLRWIKWHWHVYCYFLSWQDILRTSAAANSAGDDHRAVIMLESDCSKWWIFSSQHIKNNLVKSVWTHFSTAQHPKHCKGCCCITSLHDTFQQPLKDISLVISGKMMDGCCVGWESNNSQLRFTISPTFYHKWQLSNRAFQQKICVYICKYKTFLHHFKVWWSETNH